MDQQTVFRDVAALTSANQAAQALTVLGDAIRRGRLDADGMDKAGRRCKGLFEQAGLKKSRVLMLGQCTTTWLASALTAHAWGESRALDVQEGGYDNVLQDLLTAPFAPGDVDVVVLLPWNQRLLSTHGSPHDRVAEQCDFWRQAWRLIESRLAARIVQVGYDWMTPGAMGYNLAGKDDSDVGLIRAVNRELRNALPPGAFMVDLEQVSADLGRDRFYDARRYYWTKQPFSEPGTLRLAQHIWAGVRAQTTGPKKVVVVDLDNTLWGGVVGETGPLGITLGDGPAGEAFTAFQKYLKRLSQRGIVLAVCSKNNDADAREPFEKNSNMILTLDDFAQFEATWDAKAGVIRRIASTLQLGLDSFVFVDDNPAEREQVRQSIPELSVVELPEDPADFVRAVDAGLWFEAVDVTHEDRIRAQQYRVERQRRDLEGAFESLDDYLASLEMVGDVRPIDDADLDRVVQLLAKTNQFNLTTRRHGHARVRQMLDTPATIGLTLRLADRFGDHGLVSVIIASAEDADRSTLAIDTWLMSCRVIKRTAEEFFLNALVAAARKAGVRRVVGEYVPTQKNGLVKDLYDRVGFARCPAQSAEVTKYEMDLSRYRPLTTFIQLTGQFAGIG